MNVEIPEGWLIDLVIQYNNDFGPGSFERVVESAVRLERERCVRICDAEREFGDFHRDDVTGRIERGDEARVIPGWNAPHEEDE